MLLAPNVIAKDVLLIIFRISNLTDVFTVVGAFICTLFHESSQHSVELKSPTEEQRNDVSISYKLIPINYANKHSQNIIILPWIHGQSPLHGHSFYYPIFCWPVSHSPSPQPQFIAICGLIIILMKGPSPPYQNESSPADRLIKMCKFQLDAHLTWLGIKEEVGELSWVLNGVEAAFLHTSFQFYRPTNSHLGFKTFSRLVLVLDTSHSTLPKGSFQLNYFHLHESLWNKSVQEQMEKDLPDVGEIISPPPPTLSPLLSCVLMEDVTKTKPLTRKRTPGRSLFGNLL